MTADGIAFARRLQTKCRCQIEGFGIEGDAFQFLLQEPFAQASRNTGAPLPLYKVFSDGVQKEVRIRRLTPSLVQGKLRFRRTPGTKLLVQQMREFPVGNHDDGPDALEMCFRLGNKLADKKYGRKP
jgi:predicted phage terminase large subunit-like protein